MRKYLILLIILLFCIFLYGHYVEVNNFKVKEYTINNDKVPQSFEDLKIVQISDILYEKGYNLERILDEVNNLKADIIVYSGDLFKKNYSYNEEDYNTLKDFFKKLNASLYKYAVIGDNDMAYLDKYKDILYDANFKLLDDSNMLLFYKDPTPINIVGITNPEKIEDLLTADVEYNYTLVITHKPDNIISLSNYDVDTILSGHSLGGIINVPFYGGIIKKEGAQTYIYNTYKLNNTEIFISNGLGYEKFNFRLFNTPSINVYRFNTQKEHKQIK